MFERNRGYISLETQQKLATVKVLFAGCGVGSAPAEAAARLGVLNFILVDGDTVESHNLNRQSFEHEDIGKSKVESLKKRILRINPNAHVEAIHGLVTRENSQALVSKADVIFDTIDFLDLEAIVGLHDAAHEMRKPVISLFTAGFGAVGIFVPGEKRARSWIRDIFQLEDAELKNESYTAHFFKFFERMAVHLNPDVQRAMGEVFQKMKDGIPCPAPHVVSGSASASALGTYVLTQYLSGAPVKSAPEFMYLDLAQVINECGFEVW